MTPTDSQAARLLPCPFCGNDVNDDEGCFPCGPKYWEVRCGNPECFAHDPVRSTREEAITAWNTRPREQNGEVEEKAVATLLDWQPLTGLNKGDRLYQILEAAGLPFEQQSETLKAALAAALGKSNG